MEECLLYREATVRFRPTPCHRKVRCGLQRVASLWAGKQSGAAQWMADLELEEAFGGPPTWVKDSAWGYFTPQEKRVLERWDRMREVQLGRQWQREQTLRDKPRQR